MTGSKKIIGICLSKVEDDFRIDFLANFYNDALKNGFRPIVFHSPRDLYYGDVYDEGSKSIFDKISFASLDALIILSESFYDRSVVDDLINKASENDLPVILVHGENDKCYSIVTDYTEAYKDILRHLFRCHSIKSPVFIGGNRENDDHTVIRLNCFKEILDEFGIEYKDSMLYYGEYWDQPTLIAVREILRSPAGIPDAIICANDTMAMTVCEVLSENGYKVPENIKVTGFDGLLSAEYFVPRLTTCREDIGALSDMVCRLLNGAFECKTEKGVFREQFVPYISESCCGSADNGIDFRKRACDLFKMVYATRQHESHIYKWTDKILDIDSLKTLSIVLRDYILPNSCVCLNESFIMSALSKSSDKIKDQVFAETIAISSKSPDYSNGRQGSFAASDMIPDKANWIDETTMCILTPIFVGEESCGYYITKTDDIRSTAPKLFRISKTMNVAFGALMSRISNRRMQSSILNAQYLDPLTGIANLKGLTKWFADFSKKPENHSKTVMISVYNIPQYKFIYSNYGIEDIEETIRFTADALKLANKDNGYIARTGSDEFIVFNFVDNADDVDFVIDNAVSVFYGIIEGYNSSSDKDYYLEVNCGCTVAYAGWNNDLSTFIKLANNEMYINKLKAGMSPVLKEEKVTSGANISKDLYLQFSQLIEKNLFTYYFQPIIDAKTGDICAYEALMRTTGGIKMSPLEILDIAKEHNRLYEIEKATMFNIMTRYVRELEKFSDRKIFINTIPGNFLKKDDLSELKDKFSSYISSFVFEITEQDTVSDNELHSMRDLGIVGNSEEFKNIAGGQIAVDDYGTGHSNIVNLLRYAPHIIKIDRFLISNIQNDANKQMFVKSTIDFAKMNNIKVLAEGVETYDEMRTVIDYGVDFIQGYYTARPAEEPIDKIPENIRNEIIAENLLLSRYENDTLVYTPEAGETVKLYDLAIKKYGCVHISKDNVVIVGTIGQTFETDVIIEPGVKANVTLEDVSLKANDEPVFRLGSGSDVTLCIKGKNSIQKNGILVPANSSLRMIGDGSLNISVRKKSGVCIGNYYNSYFGNISFEHTGEINIEIQCDQTVCIGGGNNYGNTAINFISGKVSVLAQCVNSIGIGSVKGSPDISISPDAVIIEKCSGKNSVAIGSFEGDARIVLNGNVDVVSDGERCAAIGNIGIGNAEIDIQGGTIKAVVHSARAVCYGSIEGRSTVTISGGSVTAYGEGDSICGYGSIDGNGRTQISGGTAYVKILSGCILQFGGDKCTTIITGGNILAADEEDVEAVNCFGEELHPEHPGGDTFCTTISSSYGDYVYSAEKSGDDPDLVVYLP